MDGIILLVFLLALYGLPSLIASARHHHQGMAIGALNMLLGWTVLGWIAALVWALTSTPGIGDQAPASAATPAAPPLPPPPPWPASVRPDMPVERKVIALVCILALIGWAWWSWAEGGPTCSTTHDKVLDRWVTRCSDGRQYQSTYDKDFQRYRTRPMPPWKPVDKRKR